MEELEITVVKTIQNVSNMVQTFAQNQPQKLFEPISSHWPLSIPSENIRKPLIFCFQGV